MSLTISVWQCLLQTWEVVAAMSRGPGLVFIQYLQPHVSWYSPAAMCARDV